MSLVLPTAQDICSLILSVLPPNLPTNTLTVIKNVCDNLSNEYVTLNEAYNFVLGALPQIRSFFAQVDITGSLNTTFKEYTLIWISFQYGVLFLVLTVILAIMMITGQINPLVGFILIIAIAILLVILAVIEVAVLDSFLNNQQTNFQAKFTALLNSILPTAILNGVLGYVSASQLTVNGPTGPTGPGNGPIILTNPNATFDLEQPYTKLTIFRTVTPASVVQPAVFNVLLKELEITSGIVRINTVKPQYAKVIYIINGNPPFIYPNLAASIGVTGDSGIIRILNATSMQPAVATVPPAEIPLSSTDPAFFGGPTLIPPQINNGILIYPGECKCLINVGYNQNLPELSSDFPNLAFTTWVELTADIRPFSSVLVSSSLVVNLRPTTRIIFLDVPDNANVTLITPVSTDIAVNGQELYLVANPPIGPINVTLLTGVTVLPKGAIMALSFNGLTWIKLFP